MRACVHGLSAKTDVVIMTEGSGNSICCRANYIRIRGSTCTWTVDGLLMSSSITAVVV